MALFLEVLIILRPRSWILALSVICMADTSVWSVPFKLAKIGPNKSVSHARKRLTRWNHGHTELKLERLYGVREVILRPWECRFMQHAKTWIGEKYAEMFWSEILLSQDTQALWGSEVIADTAEKARSAAKEELAPRDQSFNIHKRTLLWRLRLAGRGGSRGDRRKSRPGVLDCGLGQNRPGL